MRRRLDQELVRRGLTRSRSEAREAIDAGRVTVAGRPALKAAGLVAPDEPVRLEGPARRYVSRGGEKLAAALDRFGVDPRGRRCLDAGASTGGFTDVLLQRGAAHVVAIDVGYGQLAWSLRSDPRVTPIERTNIRDVGSTDLPYRADLLVADLSFIRLGKVLPALAALAASDAEAVLLVKPQFEAGPGAVGRGGVVADPSVWRRVLADVLEDARAAGFGPQGLMASPLRGPAGNAEFLLHARRGVVGNDVDVDAAIREVPEP
ncbi:MAG TPA: TlyA family RNA methyltransferase [Actinomycetota bacterium]|nr:TlyA family RNA methyltransferase [Actinomycetota bacterium]